jgi:hypothetical protein
MSKQKVIMQVAPGRARRVSGSARPVRAASLPIAAHGSSDMPVWGPIFGWLDHYNEVSVQQRIKNLCDYLASLQEKES